MKKYGWCILLVAAVWLFPRLSHPAVDVGKLEPVETVLLTVNEWGLTIETDTGAEGYGPSLEEAIKDLIERAEANIYLDTTNKLLISGDPDAYWEAIFRVFRPSCNVYGIEGDINPVDATPYLSVHEKGITINQIRAGERAWNVLTIKGGQEDFVWK